MPRPARPPVRSTCARIVGPPPGGQRGGGAGGGGGTARTRLDDPRGGRSPRIGRGGLAGAGGSRRPAAGGGARRRPQCRLDRGAGRNAGRELFGPPAVAGLRHDARKGLRGMLRAVARPVRPRDFHPLPGQSPRRSAGTVAGVGGGVARSDGVAVQLPPQPADRSVARTKPSKSPPRQPTPGTRFIGWRSRTTWFASPARFSSPPRCVGNSPRGRCGRRRVREVVKIWLNGSAGHNM